MTWNRRAFLKTAGMAGAGALLLRGRMWAFSQSPTNLGKFVQSLPGLGPGGANTLGNYLTVLSPNTAAYPGSDYYQIVSGQFTQQMHPALPNPTPLWGYAADVASPDTKYLGGVIVAKRNRPVRIKMRNNLPATHILPVDIGPFFHDAIQHQNSIAVHLHGGFVPWISDGGPFAFYSPTAAGPDWAVSQVPDMPVPPMGSSTYYYPNQQSSRLMWYHDHAHDLTRLNAYAGLATGYVLTDDVEGSLMNSGVLPGIGIPLVLQDKSFKADGSLFYPWEYETNPAPTGRWDYGPTILGGTTNPVTGNSWLPLPDPTAGAASCVPEAFFDTIVVNGAVFPYVELQPRRYRFRVLNGSQARFYNLQLYYQNATGPDGELDLQPYNNEFDISGNPIMAPTNPLGPKFIQIGTEGGFLPKPVVLNDVPRPMGFNLDPTSPTFGNATRYNLLLAPAERADFIIDFSSCAPGDRLILYSDTPAPFPAGDPRNDYYTGAPDMTTVGGAPTPLPGSSPNTRTLMQFRIVPLVGAPDKYNFNTTLALLNNALPIAYRASQPPALPTAGVPVRALTLNEDFDDQGRLMQWMGTNVVLHGASYGRFLEDDPTEIVSKGSTEIWEIYNYTGDTHPIHFHLVNVAILSRQAFDPLQPPSPAALLGTPRPPDANELGWKETVRMNPGEVVRVIMKFDLPKLPWTVGNGPGQMKLSRRTSVGGTPVVGHEYVYHCHILEHEEHDMMRPLIVV